MRMMVELRLINSQRDAFSCAGVVLIILVSLVQCGSSRLACTQGCLPELVRQGLKTRIRSNDGRVFGGFTMF